MAVRGIPRSVEVRLPIEVQFDCGTHCGTGRVTDKRPKFGLPMRRRTGEMQHRGRVVSLLFDIVPFEGMQSEEGKGAGRF